MAAVTELQSGEISTVRLPASSAISPKRKMLQNEYTLFIKGCIFSFTEVVKHRS